VDDAIVVVEGAVHNVEKGMSGREAASAAMRQLFGPIIGITWRSPRWLRAGSTTIFTFRSGSFF